MSQQSQDRTTSHFDAAKIIVETLQGLDKTSQALAMRFAAETLGLQSGHDAQLPVQSVTPEQKPVVPIAVGGSAVPVGDIKQFTIAKAPKSDQQFAAVAAYFNRFEAPEDQRSATIDAKALINAARLANRKRPSRHVLNNARNAGYLDVVSPGKYQLTSVGENLVAMTLPGDGTKSVSPRRSRRPKPQKKKPVRKLDNRRKNFVR
jgi:hypothetical protein